MKNIKFIISFLICLFVSSIVYAANPGREINNKCRQNLKLLNSATEKFLSNNNYNLPTWTTYKQAISGFLTPEKYLDGKTIVPPTPDCEYYLVSLDRNDCQWLCMLHGVNDGNQTLSLQYHEFVLQGKSNSKFMVNENYKKHVQNMLSWTEYTLTPKEFLKYHYNMNPIMTTIVLVLVVGVGFYLLKSFFKF